MHALSCSPERVDLTSGVSILVHRAKPKVVVIPERSRTMNHMDPETKLIHIGLLEWAPWARDNGALGYPRQSLTEKAAQYGKLGIPQESNYKAESLMPDHIAVMDAAVARLCQTDKLAIFTYYLRNEAIEDMARRHSMRVRQFQNVIRRARWRLAILVPECQRSLNVTPNP